MIRHQTSSPFIMPGPLLLALLGGAFCVWSASGNALNLCVTTGCSLFQDFTVGGVSMWWFGAVAFGVLALLSISGRPLLGVLVAGLCLLIDVVLLSLMLTTAPCVGCLFSALLFALTYAAFRYSNHRREDNVPRSWLIMVWSVLFIANVGSVVKAETDTWAMLGPEDASVRLYFSPSCSACREAITTLSGRVNVAYYPVAENDQDVHSIAAMLTAVQRGDSMAQALNTLKGQEENAKKMSFSLDNLLLRYRLLRNKAHVLASGCEAVPYMEFHGLPSFLSNQKGTKGQARPTSGSGGSGGSGGASGETSGASSTDPTLPIDMGIAGSCGGANTPPCP